MRMCPRISLARLTVGVLALTALAACGNTSNKERFTYAGYEFKTKATPLDKKERPQDFVVTVKRATQSLEGARLAGHHEATEYCVTTFGSSKIQWVSGPDVEDTQLVFDDDSVLFQGTCEKTW